jgi:transcriptional regulator with XRE-family HTH domain
VRKTRTSVCPRCGGPESRISGAWLRAQRLAAGVSLRALARALGFSPAYISDIERDHRRCPPRVLSAYERLAAIKEAREK